MRLKNETINSIRIALQIEFPNPEEWQEIKGLLPGLQKMNCGELMALDWALDRLERVGKSLRQRSKGDSDEN